MVKNGIFESMIKLCSANYAPSGAQNRAKLSVKIVRKGRTPTSQNYAYLLSWDKARDITPSEAKINVHSQILITSGTRQPVY